ncbi:MAG: DUF1080 domain-containing protein, partial [Alphaproteobacteria bacterium]|nr:DUF1080 domain-containing protein [Alphaproteobacteria bacterium]
MNLVQKHESEVVTLPKITRILCIMKHRLLSKPMILRARESKCSAAGLNSLSRRLGLLAMLLLSCLGPTAAVAQEADAAGSVSIFNGTDFTGWRLGDASAMPKQIPAAWTVANSVIVGAGDPAAILASQWDYDDFEFQFEWRAANDAV